MDTSRFDNISDEVKGKAMACKTPDELIELADSEGIALSLDELDAASGGAAWDADCDSVCPELCALNCIPVHP